MLGGGGLATLVGGGRGRILLFCWLGWVFDFYDLILFSFVKRGVATDLGLGLDSDLAWIEGLTLGASAVGGFGFGILADRWGRRRSIAFSIALYSAGAFATAFTDGFASLLLARLVTGLGVGGEWGVGHTIVAESQPAHLRGRAAGLLQAGTPVAMALAAAVGCFAAPMFGWRACFLGSALPALLVVAARWALPGDDHPPGRAGAVPLLDLFRGVLARPSFALLAVLVLHMTGFWCTYAWLPSILLGQHSATFVGWFQIGISAVHVIADVVFGVLADRFGRRRTFTVFCAAFAAGLIAIAIGFDSLRDDLVLFGFALGAVGLGAGTWSCFGVLFATTYPASLRATAASGFYNVARGAQLFTLPMMGALVAWSGTFSIALVVGAVAALLSGGLIWAVPEVSARRAS